MRFFDILFRRPCASQLETQDEHVKLKEAIDEHRKAVSEAHEQIVQVERTTASLEVAAEALAAIVRGRTRPK